MLYISVFFLPNFKYNCQTNWRWLKESPGNKNPFQLNHHYKWMCQQERTSKEKNILIQLVYFSRKTLESPSGTHHDMTHRTIQRILPSPRITWAVLARFTAWGFALLVATAGNQRRQRVWRLKLKNTKLTPGTWKRPRKEEEKHLHTRNLLGSKCYFLWGEVRFVVIRSYASLSSEYHLFFIQILQVLCAGLKPLGGNMLYSRQITNESVSISSTTL